MIKAVVFDLDDTLISEDDYIKSGYAHIAEVLEKKHGLMRDDTKNELYNLYLEDNKNVFNRFMDKHGIKYEQQDIIELVNEYRNHMPNIKFFDDVIPVLNELKSRGIKTGIISDGYLATQQNKAKVLGLYDLFDKVIFTEELGREYWKPHPRAFEMMKEFFGIEYDEMVYVGDNPKKDFYISSTYPIVTVKIVRNKSIYTNAVYHENIKEKFEVNELRDILSIGENV